VPGAGKPGGGILDVRETELGTGTGRVATSEVPAGGNVTGRGSSLVRKSSSLARGEDRRREKGKVVSLKTTWREIMT
jgi:hypothetical protein